MVYTIDVWDGKLNAIFGSAYPAIGLNGDDQCAFIRDLIVDNLENGILISNRIVVVSWQLWPFKKFQIQIMPAPWENNDSYGFACKVEKYVNTFCSLRHSVVPAFLTYFLRRGYPIDSYCIRGIEVEVVAWLLENCNTRDYQVYRKSGTSFFVGFKNTEASTLFKLMFGDRG